MKLRNKKKGVMGYVKEKNPVFQWHPAFYGGMQIELAGERENLIFENLSINDFYKVYAYTCFYKSDAQCVNQIKAEEITITLASARCPRELIKHLEAVRGYEVTGENGIYYIKGDFFPIQIIVTTELPEKENFWLRYLTDDIKEAETAKKIVNEYEKHQNEGLYQSVMELIVSANSETFKEAKNMCQALEELFREDFEKEFEAIRIKDRAEGHAVKLIEMVCRKMAKGKVVLQIVDELGEDESNIKKIYDAAISFATDFDAEKIYRLLRDK